WRSVVGAARREEEVVITVVVQILETEAPRDGAADDTAGKDDRTVGADGTGHVREAAATVVPRERDRADVGDGDIEPAVSVVVADADAHRVHAEVQARACGGVDETGAGIAPQDVAVDLPPEVVDDVEVG